MSIWIPIGIMLVSAFVSASSRLVPSAGTRLLLSAPAGLGFILAIWWTFDHHGWWQVLLMLIGTGMAYNLSLVLSFKVFGARAREMFQDEP